MRKICFLLSFICSISAFSQEQFIKTSDSVQLFVKVNGTGPACLYIHGGPGSGSNWLEEFMGDSLEKHFQMIYLDQRGVGRSSSPADNNYSMDRMVKDFEEVRTALGIKKWIIFGHSFGGILQMGYINRKPDVISGLVFINCTLYMNDSFEKSWLPKAIEFAGDDVPAVCVDTSISIYNRMLAIMPVLQEKGVMWKIFFNSPDDNRRMNETYRKFEKWNGDLSEKILDIPEYWEDYRVFTENIHQPVLFYYGRTDWAIDPEHYLGVKFPNMILWGSDTGHMPFLENKADVMQAIEKYLQTYL